MREANSNCHEAAMCNAPSCAAGVPGGGGGQPHKPFVWLTKKHMMVFGTRSIKFLRTMLK